MMRSRAAGIDRLAAAPTAPMTLDLETVYDEHASFVWRTLRLLGVPPAGLEDAVQEVFLVVHRRLAGFEGRSSIRTWLYAIARRVAGNVQAKNLTRAQRVSQTLDAMPGPRVQQTNRFDRHDDRAD